MRRFGRAFRLVFCLIAAAVSTASPHALAFSPRVLLTRFDGASLKTGPGPAFSRISVLCAGIPMWCIDKTGQWYAVQVADGLKGWVREDEALPTNDRSRPETALLREAKVYSGPAGIVVQIGLSRRVPYQILVDPERPELEVRLFQTVAAVYWVKLLPGCHEVANATFFQESRDIVRVRVWLSGGPLCGVQVAYRGESLRLRLRRPWPSGDLAGKVIVIDPGHGGPDTGAASPRGLREKDLNLAIALRAEQFFQQAGAKVFLLRRGDESVSGSDDARVELRTRRLRSKALAPHLFVSIHCNSVSDPTVGGTEVYYWNEFSLPAARCMLGAVAQALGTQPRFVAKRPFAVIREWDCPRVLVECLYLSNPEDEERAMAPDFADRAARGIVEGARRYFASEWARWRGQRRAAEGGEGAR